MTIRTDNSEVIASLTRELDDARAEVERLRVYLDELLDVLRADYEDDWWECYRRAK